MFSAANALFFCGKLEKKEREDKIEHPLARSLELEPWDTHGLFRNLNIFGNSEIEIETLLCGISCLSNDSSVKKCEIAFRSASSEPFDEHPTYDSVLGRLGGGEGKSM